MNMEIRLTSSETLEPGIGFGGFAPHPQAAGLEVPKPEILLASTLAVHELEPVTLGQFSREEP